MRHIASRFISIIKAISEIIIIGDIAYGFNKVEEVLFVLSTLDLLLY
jgi:hypothetical protein